MEKRLARATRIGRLMNKYAGVGYIAIFCLTVILDQRITFWGLVTLLFYIAIALCKFFELQKRDRHKNVSSPEKALLAFSWAFEWLWRRYFFKKARRPNPNNS